MVTLEEMIPAFAGTSVVSTRFLGEVKTEKRKGFTLIELMVIIFIIGILAVAAIPFMRGRVDSAKWSEGKAAAGSLRTAARAFCAEKGPDWGGTWVNVDLDDLGFTYADLSGKYFNNDGTNYGAYSISFTGYDTYTVTVTASNSSSSEKPSWPSVVTLNQDGTWDETP